ncbi:MAG TPA: Gfo/Idh/MocA family oxidoreductase [Planctomycetaceae bacterium]|nr:Gfo/Idh/MocA family oxidoreductase [Planctomycetaceae bacterium]
MAVNLAMESPRSHWRLKILGDNHRARFFRERWQLLNPARLLSGSSTGSTTGVTAYLVVVPVNQRGTLVADLLTAGHPVIVEPPLTTTLQEALELFALAERHGAALRVIALRRTEPDYLAATMALAPGRIGSPVGIRWYAAEYAVWADAAAADYRRGETFALAAPPLFDQLAGLVTAEPRTVRAVAYPAEDGFAIEVTFTDGCQARLEIRRMARVALRTGWMIEGTTGSYHHGKLITTTADGELVDESITTEAFAIDPVQELETAGTLTSMSAEEQRRGLFSAGLYEAAARSLLTGQPVEWNSL